MFRRLYLSMPVLLFAGISNAAEIVSVVENKSIAQSALIKQLTNKAYETLKEIKRVKLPNGKEKVKLRQMLNHIPVWGMHVSATLEGDLYKELVGHLMKQINVDKLQKVHLLSTEEIKRRLLSGNSNHFIKNIKNYQSKLYLTMNKNREAEYRYLVSYFIAGEVPSRPMAWVNASTGKVIDSWDGLTKKHAKGNGGNEKINLFRWARGAHPVLVVSKDCQMSSNHANVVDMKHQTEGGEVFIFESCPDKDADNNYKAINGAYSPLNDALGYIDQLYLMFRDWYQIKPLNNRAILRVHYGKNYNNAFWNGKSVSFGDGNNTFYPFTGLDVVAHEMAHGLTEQHSGLLNTKQPGAINESFSDITGEAVKAYFGRAGYYYPWMLGEDIVKGPRGRAIRYFEDPTKDGKSIKHAKDYSDNLNVHYAAGIFNHAFYVLANKSGWNIRKAYDVFLLANQVFWDEEVSFDEGACGIKRAAADLNYPEQDIVDAFKQVGVDASCKLTPTGNDKPIKSNETIGSLSGKKGKAIVYYIDLPPGKSHLVIRTSGGSGDVDLYVQQNKHPTLREFNCRPYLNGNKEECVFITPLAGRYYIMLYGYEAYKDVKLYASRY